MSTDPDKPTYTTTWADDLVCTATDFARVPARLRTAVRFRPPSRSVGIDGWYCTIFAGWRVPAGYRGYTAAPYERRGIRADSCALRADTITSSR
jgi:hypothetical protein